ncbi:hypothetical protein KR52_11735 [Synechococcus sp. KORDI-52]|uniref:hypothetical protein n=1 Tax=Synechococcus sp. KORDI-52 TaxID=585425 RepID=UPI0004E0A700|nr:hypothetical protein [Synechococcus sp. KORDI-52]AII49803.1 hypothetical protein KR52_11735 [Synechococcus sp. KORDI-52]
MNAHVIDAKGRWTYMGEDGCRGSVGDPSLLEQLRTLRDQPTDDGCGSLQS